MLTNLLLWLLTIYLVLALVAGIWVQLNDIPRWLDRATAYGDGKLNWAERLTIAILMPGMLVYIWRFDRWPGIKDCLPEFWVTIVLGRQMTAGDVGK